MWHKEVNDSTVTGVSVQHSGSTQNTKVKRPRLCKDCLKGLNNSIIKAMRNIAAVRKLLRKLVWGENSHTHSLTLLSHLSVDLVKQGEQKGVEVPQEESEDASELPLEGNPRMVILKLSYGLKQRRTHQTKQRHDDLQLSKIVKITDKFFHVK